MMVPNHSAVASSRGQSRASPPRRSASARSQRPARGAPQRTQPAAGPVRTCVACRQQSTSAQLLRLVVGPDGRVAADLAGGAHGRGAWVHPQPECVGAAATGGLARSLRRRVGLNPEQLWSEIRAAAERRAWELVSAARRARRLAVGSGAVREALGAPAVGLVVVAVDARTSAAAPEVQEAIASGRAVGWGTKATLGRSVGRPEAGVVAVLDSGLARALSGAIRMASMAASQMGSRNVGVDGSTEVR